MLDTSGRRTRSELHKRVPSHPVRDPATEECIDLLTAASCRRSTPGTGDWAGRTHNTGPRVPRYPGLSPR